jgi:hypothetical protein
MKTSASADLVGRAIALVILALTALLASARPAHAQQAVSHETTTVNGTAVGLQASTTSPTGVGPVSQCTISVENGAVRFWTDGAAPTGTTGHLVAAGGMPIVLTSYVASASFQAINVNQSAVLQTTCARVSNPAIPLLSFFGAPGRLPPCNGVQATNCTPKGY